MFRTAHVSKVHAELKAYQCFGLHWHGMLTILRELCLAHATSSTSQSFNSALGRMLLTTALLDGKVALWQIFEMTTWKQTHTDYHCLPQPLNVVRCRCGPGSDQHQRIYKRKPSPRSIPLLLSSVRRSSKSGTKYPMASFGIS